MLSLFTIFLIISALLILLSFIRWCQIRFNLHPEITRKIMHIALGLASLGFPWVFKENWEMIVFFITALSVLLGLRFLKSFKSNLGVVLHNIDRKSGGELYFLLAILILFFISKDDRALYVIPILILTFSDALAALMGLRYGQSKYMGADTFKSIEGSLSFFSSAFLSTQISLFFLTDIKTLELILISLITAFVSTIIEAISWRGLDNLFIPLGSYIVLAGHLKMKAYNNAQSLIFIISSLIIAPILRKCTPLTDGALGVSILYVFTCFEFTNWRWLIVVLLGFMIFLGIFNINKRRNKLGGQLKEEVAYIYSVRVVASFLGPTAIWLITSKYFNRPEDFYCFSLAWAAQLVGFIVFAREENHEGTYVIVHKDYAWLNIWLKFLATVFIMLFAWACLVDISISQKIILFCMGVLNIFILLKLCVFIAHKRHLTIQGQFFTLSLAGFIGFFSLVFLDLSQFFK